MAEKPLLMSGPMVRAILDGQKTVTRRPMTPQPPESSRFKGLTEHGWAWTITVKDPAPPIVSAVLTTIRRSDFQPGDIAWVRETWRTWKEWDGVKPSEIPKGQVVFWEAAETDRSIRAYGRLRPSIFMCRWMSRCRVLIVGAHPERVQDITEEDAQREGITGDDSLVGQIVNPYRTAFADLWDSIYGDRFPFADNPWVWRYEFELMEDA